MKHTMLTRLLEIKDLVKQCHKFTFWQSASGFGSKSMGELDTQLVTVNAGGRGLMKATGGAIARQYHRLDLPSKKGS